MEAALKAEGEAVTAQAEAADASQTVNSSPIESASLPAPEPSLEGTAAATDSVPEPVREPATKPADPTGPALDPTSSQQETQYYEPFKQEPPAFSPPLACMAPWRRWNNTSASSQDHVY